MLTEDLCAGLFTDCDVDLFNERYHFDGMFSPAPRHFCSETGSNVRVAAILTARLPAAMAASRMHNPAPCT